MKLAIFGAFLVTISSGARLENTYLPPNGGKGAEGGSDLVAPKAGGNGKSTGIGGDTKPLNGTPGGGGGDGGGGEGGGGGSESIPIISLENINNGNGSYKYSYETGNGIKAQEEGELKTQGQEEGELKTQGQEEGELKLQGQEDNFILSVIGYFSYTAPDGQEFKIEYTADENGFVPKGAHLPTPPPIPKEILKSLEQNAAEEVAKGGEGYPSDKPNGEGGGGGGGDTNNKYKY